MLNGSSLSDFGEFGRSRDQSRGWDRRGQEDGVTTHLEVPTALPFGGADGCGRVCGILLVVGVVSVWQPLAGT